MIRCEKMTKVVAHEWAGLYHLIDSCYYDCWGANHRPSLQTRYGETFMGTSGNYKVLFKCGTSDLTFINLDGAKVPCTGYVDHLTKEQVDFLYRRGDKVKAVMAVGEKWPGKKKALLRAIKAD